MTSRRSRSSRRTRDNPELEAEQARVEKFRSKRARTPAGREATAHSDTEEEDADMVTTVTSASFTPSKESAESESPAAWRGVHPELQAASAEKQKSFYDELQAAGQRQQQTAAEREQQHKQQAAQIRATLAKQKQQSQQTTEIKITSQSSQQQLSSSSSSQQTEKEDADLFGVDWSRDLTSKPFLAQASSSASAVPEQKAVSSQPPTEEAMTDVSSPKVEELEQTVASLQRQLDDAHKTIRQQNADLQTAVQRAARTLIGTSLTTAPSDYRPKNSEVSRLTDQLFAEFPKIATMIKSSLNAAKKVADLELKISALKTAHQEDNKKLREELGEEGSQTIEAAKAKAAEEIRAAEQKASAAEQKASAAETRAKDLEIKWNSDKGKISTLEEQFQALQLQLKQANGALSKVPGPDYVQKQRQEVQAAADRKYQNAMASWKRQKEGLNKQLSDTSDSLSQAQADKKALDAQITELTREKNSAIDSRDAKERSLIGLDSERRNIEKQRDAAQEKAQKLDDDLIKVRQELAKKVNEVANFNNWISPTKHQEEIKAAKEEQAAETKRTIDQEAQAGARYTAAVQKQQYDQEIATLKQQYQDALTARDTTNATLLQAEKKKADDALLSLKEANLHKVNDTNEITKIKKELEDYKTEQKKELTTLKNDKKLAEAAKEAAEGSLVDERIKVRTLEAEKKRLEDEEVALKKRIKNLQETQSTTSGSGDDRPPTGSGAKSTSEVKKLKTRITELEGEVARLERESKSSASVTAKLVAAETLALELREQIRKLVSEKTELLEAKRDKETAEQRLKEANAALAEQKLLVANQGIDMDRLKSELKKSESVAAAFEQAKDDALQENIQLSGTNVGLTTDLQRANIEVAKLKPLQETLERKNKLVEETSQENARLKSKLSEIEVEIVTLKKQVTDKQRDLDETDAKYRAAQSSIDTLAQKVASTNTSATFQQGLDKEAIADRERQIADLTQQNGSLRLKLSDGEKGYNGLLQRHQTAMDALRQRQQQEEELLDELRRTQQNLDQTSAAAKQQEQSIHQRLQEAANFKAYVDANFNQAVLSTAQAMAASSSGGNNPGQPPSGQGPSNPFVAPLPVPAPVLNTGVRSYLSFGDQLGGGTNDKLHHYTFQLALHRQCAVKLAADVLSRDKNGFATVPVADIVSAMCRDTLWAWTIERLLGNSAYDPRYTLSQQLLARLVRRDKHTGDWAVSQNDFVKMLLFLFIDYTRQFGTAELTDPDNIRMAFGGTSIPKDEDEKIHGTDIVNVLYNMRQAMQQFIKARFKGQSDYATTSFQDFLAYDQKKPNSRGVHAKSELHVTAPFGWMASPFGLFEDRNVKGDFDVQEFEKRARKLVSLADPLSALGVASPVLAAELKAVYSSRLRPDSWIFASKEGCACFRAFCGFWWNHELDAATNVERLLVFPEAKQLIGAVCCSMRFYKYSKFDKTENGVITAVQQFHETFVSLQRTT